MKSLLVTPAAAAVLLLTSLAAHAGEYRFYESWGVAIKGYDPVAYFTETGPQKGDKKLTVDYGGTTWRFASEENRQRFLQSPAQYLPQYGGYCAWAVAEKDKLVKVDPRVWHIEDGKLYLNYNSDVKNNWDKDRTGFIREGNSNWQARGFDN